MKNIFFILAIVVFSLVANLVNASDTLSGNSLSKFGTYQLSPSTNSLVIKDVAYKTWELTYSGTPEKYVLFVVPGENGNCCFNVRGENFEIRYSLTFDNFGAKLIDPEFRTIPRKEIMKKLNNEQLKSQEVITTSPKTETEYLGLIACFMPLLMN
jgi:hypothetical protein